MNPINFNQYFGFVTEPFTNEIKAAALFISAALKTLSQRLTHHLARRGIALITGDVGSGKTTAIRAFVETLDKTHHDIVYIDDPTLGLRGIWHSIAEQLHLNDRYFKWQLMPTLKATLEKNFVDYRKTTVIIIDDAQLLKPAALDELRLFTNFRFDSASPLTLILLAQPEFSKLIQLTSLAAFNQRITLRSHLTGLAQDEVKPYIKQQLAIAGRTDELFTDDVIAEIYHQAKGLPRLINTLCYQCLFEIYLQSKNIVDIPTIEQVLCNYEIA